MTTAADYKKRYADFPWLSLDNPEGVEAYLSSVILEHGEQVVDVARAGEGNMNLALRVRTSLRTVVLKQARPWVEKYDHIAAPWDRIPFEQRYYGRTQGIPGVASRSPTILAVDAAARAIVMECIEDARDFVDLYDGGAIERETCDALAEYLHALHESTRGGFDESLSNREMRALNHEHIFQLPLRAHNGLELDGFEPGLTAAAARLAQDAELKSVVDSMGHRYLADGACLLHGDFFPGSWLRSPRGLFVIDPEFCYFGDVEFDLGVAVAHLALANQSLQRAAQFLTSYAGKIDAGLLGKYAGIEVIRRLAGVAQLPIPPSADFRVPLLLRARKAVLDARYEALWE